MDEQKKYIDAEEAKKCAYLVRGEEHPDTPPFLAVPIACIDRMQAADVQPVKRGRWIYKKKLRGGFNRVNGVDDDGNTVTITVDNRREIDEPYCSECGKWNDGSNMDYCGVCGAYMC